MPQAEIDLRLAAQAANPLGTLAVRWANITGTPLTAAAPLDCGQEVADLYEVRFHVAGAVVTADVTAGPHNPYPATGLAVVADGATENRHLVPGAGVVVAAGVADGDHARVAVGYYLTATGAATPALATGVVETGQVSSAARLAAVNIGDRTAWGCSLIALPGFRWSPTAAGTWVKLIDNHKDASRERLAVTGTYTLTFTDWKDAGGGLKSADLLVNGNLAVSDAVFDGATRYEHGHASYDDLADLLRGLAIVLQPTTQDPAGVTITLVVDAGAYLWAELAQDVGGAPGVWGTTAVELTESGQPDGAIPAGGIAYAWHRWNLPDNATLGNLRLWNPRVKGATI